MKVVENEVNTSEVMKYIIKEVEFYDAAGKCVVSKPVAIYPVREYLVEYGTEEPVSKKICCIPYADKGFKKLINRKKQLWF